MFNIKKITSLILSLLMIVCSFGTVSFAEDSEESARVIIDSTNISGLSKNNEYSSISTDVVRLSDKSLKLSGDGSTGGSTSSESKRYSISPEQDWTGFNYINILAMNESVDSSFRLDLTLYGITASAAVGHWYKDNVTVSGSGWKIVSVDLSAFKQAYSGSTVAGDKYSEMNNIEGIFFDGIKNTLYVEKIWLSKEMPVQTQGIASEPADGSDDVSVNTKNVTFFYNGTLAGEEMQTADITVTAGETQTDAYTVTYSSDRVTVDFTENLEFNTEYTVTLKGVMDSFGADIEDCTVKFTTSPKAPVVSAPALTDENGEELSALPESGTVASEISVYNPTEEACSATLVLACYDSNGRMISGLTVFETAEISSGESKDISAQIESEDYSSMSVYAFVLDDMTKRNLLTPSYAHLPEDESADVSEATEGEADTLTLESFDFSNDTALLTASINGSAERTLLLTLASEGSVKHIIPLTGNRDGSVKAECKMTDSDPSGMYSMVLSGRKIENTVSSEFYHLSENDKSDVFEIANSLKNEDEALSMLKDYSEVFLLEDTTISSPELMLMTGEAVYANKPFDNFESIKSFVKEAEAVCAGLSGHTWDTLAAYILENEEILIGDYNISYFKNLSKTKQSKVCKLISDLEFSSLSDLREKLSDAVDEYKASLKSDSGKKSGGSSGGGGGYSVQTPVIPEVIEPAVPVITPEQAVEENEPDFEFTDLDGFEWAEESINSLTSQDIISKADDGIFRPGDMITRSEFVKLLVCALYGTSESGNASFTDVSENDWCYPYVAAAFQNGLITGRADGSFGKDDPITRQEMAAVIYRAIRQKNINIAATLSEYTYSDDNTIADYAKDAVYALYHTGIMSGMGEGRFSPDENANRAQAACVIDRVLKGGTNE